MTAIYLVRHGQTEWNRLGKLQGHTDIPLNDQGKRQALKVSEYFKNTKINKVYASPLKRASETASLIKSDLELIKDTRLIERDYGQASGLTKAERIVRFSGNKYPGMEETPDVQKRMLDVLHEIGRDNEGSVLVVSHGSAINAVLAALTDGKIGTGKTVLKTCSFNLLKYDNDTLNLEYYNKDLDHE